MKQVLTLILGLGASSAMAETRSVYLLDEQGTRIQIANVEIEADGEYVVSMRDEPFTNHFLSMRPFRCLDGPQKNWCHVPYPYEIKRNITDELTDLEYDFLFVWKGSGDYGINMWNGVYYNLQEVDGQIVGALHEMDMDTLSAPPDAGELRPIKAKHLHESDPESHWLPHLIVE
jgi:hypothetical protein